MEPLFFEPYFRPQIWGGRRLESILHKALPPTGTFGESWEVSAHPHHVSRVAGGDFAGQSLDQLTARYPAELLGHSSAKRFPLLVKFLDCEELLSVQVHPNDEQAGPLAGEEQGKSEAWYVIAAEPGARVYAGLKPGVDRSKLTESLAKGTVAECLHQFTPQAGDVIDLPAGTVHAVGGGVLLAEVQQSSDATFRLFDWNRVGPDGKPRALHIDPALAAIDWSAGPVAPIRSQAKSSGSAGELVRSPYFLLDRLDVSGSIRLSATGRMRILIAVAGSMTLASVPPKKKHRWTLSKGETVLLPAGCGELTLVSDQPNGCTLLLAALPD